MIRKLTRSYRYAGVYMIKNQRNGKVYIGSSENIENRIAKHRSDLERGIHYNRELQKDYDNSCKMVVDVLYVEVIHGRQSLDMDTKRRIQAMECEYIQKYNAIEKGYNQLHAGECVKKII